MTDNTPEAALDKTFDPARIEAKWYAHWETGGLFRPDRPDAQPFTIVNPPPNVTGSLHVGHALDNTLQDVVIRYERLRGKDALWVVGTDHAGIATQMVVERQLEERQDKRTNYTRDEFVKKVWEWKAESGGAITRQLRRLGCSMDWSREQFTMDPHFTRAVVKVFVDLHREGLIYRDKRLVNWDPRLKTAISDVEVETREVSGSFWHFKYPLSDGSGHISVATTRPETMLADMAVAVNPADARYKPLIERGATVTLPITGREIPIVADEHADPELGSGAVKITPGHDFNDFEVGKRAGFKPAQMLNMLDAEARVCQTADRLIPAELIGLDRYEARARVVELMDNDGLLEKVEERVIPTPYGDRGGVVIEPWLTDQWYVDAKALARAPIEAVRAGAIEIVPKAWEKTFFNWMENIQPWCVSRQLWWGHRIPAWYGPKIIPYGGHQKDPRLETYFYAPDEREIFVAESEEAAIALASEHYAAYLPEGGMVPVHPSYDAVATDPLPSITRDPDVLDTWFSSALWPFATLGWPESENPPRVGEDLLSRHYPNDLLISGFDILFYWDARMAMQGLHFMKQVPWKRLYLHGLVRAADGQKMSKSKGNVVDPLGMIDKYGADALRFFMAAMESQGRDVKMDEKRVEGYRNFATKLWNAARFCQSNGIGASTSIAAPEARLAVNKWIIGEVVETVAALDKALAELRFDAAANAIYHFVWDQFCDWYLELIKPVLNPPRDGEVAARSADGGDSRPDTAAGEDANPLHHPAGGPPPRAGEDETRAVAGWVLDQILVMLHPFMPFVTEELWSKLGERPYELIVAKWPQPVNNVTLNAGVHRIDADARDEMQWIIEAISNLRATKNEVGIAPGQRLVGYVEESAPIVGKYLANGGHYFDRVGRINIRYPDKALEGSALRISIPSATLVIPLEGVIDIAAEKARLEKALAASQKERGALAKRLENPAFVEKAKPEAVEKARADHAMHAAEAERLAAALKRLG
ncbi:valyl-tRNA synthetase [Novosphingobium sp. CF614]|uniref:valine--tRNA ligase n=1 Tax=Novosphingobium sp. CF614 TaxID=1884364 RepID=UPI0008E11D9F|nr:valine--tRNA ligase [Novosphingobium sp. CF614]SFG04958.1 valyl-tRNA synthetase [Novosphingobium sp. CF614]